MPEEEITPMALYEVLMERLNGISREAERLLTTCEPDSERAIHARAALENVDAARRELERMISL